MFGGDLSTSFPFRGGGRGFFGWHAILSLAQLIRIEADGTEVEKRPHCVPDHSTAQMLEEEDFLRETTT
jgi:hypothetical protein